jgi:hypothetical protein
MPAPIPGLSSHVLFSLSFSERAVSCTSFLEKDLKNIDLEFYPTVCKLKMPPPIKLLPFSI